MDAFPYLGRTIAYNISNWVAVYHNLKKAKQRWWVISKVMAKTGAMVQDYGMIYKSADQKVLLFGSESWVAMGEILKVLEVFHHQAARQITGMTAQHMEDGDWEYPTVTDALEAAGLWPIKK